MLLTIEQLQQLQKENLNRFAYLRSELTSMVELSKHEYGDSQLLVLSKATTEVFVELVNGLKFCTDQSEIIANGALSIHANGLENYRLLLSDKKTSEAEKIELLVQMVETALQFVSPEVRAYLDAKKSRLINNLIHAK